MNLPNPYLAIAVRHAGLVVWSHAALAEDVAAGGTNTIGVARTHLLDL